MKSTKLEGKALAIAHRIAAASDNHNAVHAAWEEKINREHDLMIKGNQDVISGLLKSLGDELGVFIDISQERPQLDLRYCKEHGLAFLIYEEARQDNETAPGEH